MIAMIGDGRGNVALIVTQVHIYTRRERLMDYRG